MSLQGTRLQPFQRVDSKNSHSNIRVDSPPADEVAASADGIHAQEVIESISEAFISLDHDWRFTYVNHTAERLLGKSASDLLGKDHWEVYPEAIGTIIEREFRRAAASRTAVEFENFYDPWQRWFEVKACPLHHGLAVFFRDITERKKKGKTTRSVEPDRQRAFE
jgi:PAS domain S-box-containing protein